MAQKDAIQQADTVEITDLNTFVHALVHWHQAKVAMLRHMKQIPPGTEVSVDDGPDVALEGDLLKGFQIGVELALGELGVLPFNFDLEEEIGKPSAGPQPVSALN